MIPSTNKLCLLLLILTVALCQSPPPLPYCKSKPIIQLLPLTVGEIMSGDLSSAFSGYNLNITIRKGTDIAQTVEKLVQKVEINNHMSRLISAFVEHRGNNWGSYGYVLTEDAGLVELHLYSVKNGTLAYDNTVFVLYDLKTVCFDAAVFLDRGIAIVDCAEFSGGDNSSNIVGIKNKFVYLDLASGSVKKSVYNEMYESFSNITRRKFARYHDMNTGYQYLIRTYFANGVDQYHRGNTYIEYFSAYDIEDLQIMRVIDRSYLGLPELAITDFKIYLGDMFLLDYFRGVYRLDITHGQHVVITGRYEGEFFTKMSVYSDDLDEQVLLALSNEHSVYEINMDRPSQPLLMYKYSLMQHSMVHNIMVDEKYLLVQASANATDDKNVTTMLNYTWVFTKGSRTYMNAYKVISHNSSDVFIDMNRHENELITFDQKGAKQYKLNDVTIYFQQKDNTTLGKTYDIEILANSTDPVFGSPTTASCTETTQVVMIQPNNMTIWPTKIPLSDTYYTNYPGRLEIFLDRYVIGPNITYNVEQTMIHKDLPQHWINQQNQSYVHMDKPPVIGDINFFYSEVVPHYGSETVIYYFQDIRNSTSVANCVHLWEDINLNCTIVATYSHTGRIDQFATAIFNFDEQWRYYYIWTLATATKTIDSINNIYIIDFIKHQRLATIELPKGYQGYVGDIATSNGILFLLLPYMKTILAYRLQDCIESACKLSFTIDHNALKNHGIQFFSPTDIITTRHHPEVLFIQCYGSVIILDVDNRNNLILLDELYSQAINKNDYKVAVNENFLVVVAAPNMIEEYSLENIYTARQVKYYKQLPLYNYTIPVDFDLEFSDFGDLFYINTVDTATNLTTVLIYRTGSFSASSLYDVVNVPGLYSHKNLQIQVSGYFVDFVSIIASGSFYLYLQFQIPMMIMQSDVLDFQFYLHFMNHQTSQNLSLVSVKTTNYPTGFKPTPEFEKIKSTLKGYEGQLSWDTKKWFQGHVVRYNYTCDDCRNGKIELISHIHNTGMLRVGGADYAETFWGGNVLWEDIFRLRLNGSIAEVLLLPDPKRGERCVRTVSTPDDVLTATGCRVNNGGTHVYLTSTAGHRGFTWGPYQTSAYNIQNLQIVNQLLVITDVDQYPQFRLRSGGVYIYALNLDPISNNELDQIDYIDSNDFQGTHDWDEEDVYIGNSHLMYDSFDEMYRLYVTELNHGLFVMDFKFKFGARDINIMTTAYIDMNKVLNEHNFHMPTDAYFLAVTHTGFKYNPVLQVQNILVTTSGYHNFQLTLIYDQKGQLTSTLLHRVYYRYGYYQTHNYVKSANGYFAISHIIPPVFQYMTNYSRQLITLYDTQDYEGEFEKGYSERYMLGAHMFNHTDQCAFGFNTTYDPRTNGTRIGLVIVDGVSDRMWEASISRNLSFEVKAGTPAQKVVITPYSDFHKESFEVEVEAVPGPSPQPDTGLAAWRIVLIVIGSLVAAGFISYIIFLCYKKRKTEQEAVNPLEEGLNEDEDGSAERVPALNESVAYSESVRNTIEPTRDTLTEQRIGEQAPAVQAPPAEEGAAPVVVAAVPVAVPVAVPPPVVREEPVIVVPDPPAPPAAVAPVVQVEAPPAPVEAPPAPPVAQPPAEVPPPAQ